MPPRQTPQIPTKWTVMVFMGAANFTGSASLFTPAHDDLKEMMDVGSDSALDIFVQIHGIEATPLRTHVRKNSAPLSEVPANDANTAGGHALERFIQWSIETARHDPNNDSHCSLLVLWGHAFDFAIGRSTRQDGLIEALDFGELASVLKRLQRRTGTRSKLDILGFDACDLATVEMACQLQPFAKYLLGSQIGIPIPGWPYDRVLDRLKNPKVQLMGPAELGAYIVRRFCEAYRAKAPVSLSLLDLDRTLELASRSNMLALLLADTIDDPADADRIAELFVRSQTGPGRPHVDVADLCLTLMREVDDGLVVEAARMLGDFLLGPGGDVVGLSAAGGGKPFIVEHGRNAGETARLNGISLYAPHVAPDLDFEAARPLYQNFTFAQQTHWSDLVHALARRI